MCVASLQFDYAWKLWMGDKLSSRGISMATKSHYSLRCYIMQFIPRNLSEARDDFGIEFPGEFWSMKHPVKKDYMLVFLTGRTYQNRGRSSPGHSTLQIYRQNALCNDALSMPKWSLLNHSLLWSILWRYDWPIKPWMTKCLPTLPLL